MAKMTKRAMAEILKRSGYFFKYHYICDIVKDFTWQDLKNYYDEMIENKI